MIKLSTILEPTGVKVSRLHYNGTDTTYITYFFYNENGEAFAENKEIDTSYFVQVNIWTKGDFTDLAKQVLQLMKEAGYYRIYSTELYEDDTKIYHKVIRFQYTESSQN